MSEDREGDADPKKHRLRSQFLAIVSHDLRNPLNAIVLNASLLKRYVKEGEASEGGLARIDNIHRLAKSMNRLIDLLMDIDAIDSGKFNINKRTYSVMELIRDVVETFLPLADARGIHLEAEVMDESITAMFDYDRMEQVLSNLIGNAIKFTPAKGTITIEVPITNEDHLTISVSNTGEPIPPAEREKIFEKFAQGDVTAGGFGLGLFICRWIVQAHGGKIWIADSDKTKFCVLIPRS